jgi:glycine/D-amino acid oxidase-like deaminating enzyme
MDGLDVAAGISGHGVMHSRAVGRIVADLVVDGHCDTPDITLLFPLRFDKSITSRSGDSTSF